MKATAIDKEIWSRRRQDRNELRDKVSKNADGSPVALVRIGDILEEILDHLRRELL